MPKEITEDKPSAAKYIYVLAVFIGLIMLASTYVAYTYFNSSKDASIPNEIAGVDVTDTEPDDSLIQPLTQSSNDEIQNDSFGILNDDSNIIAPTKIKGVQSQNITDQVKLESTPASDTSGITNPKTWKANDYKFGDIKTGEYTIIYGDTLWEISEGAYGTGSKWVKIASVNTIDYFSNGRPLIHIGQVISIPE